MTATGLGDRMRGTAIGRSALIYVPIAWVVLQVTDLFVTQFGLPSWVFSGAFALMAVGFVVVVSAAAARARPDGTPRTWLSRRRVLLGGVAVLALWALIAAGYMGARAAGVGPFGTLVASGAVAPGGKILIADFENRTKDPDLDEAVRQAMAVDLGQSPLVQVADPRDVAGALQRMEREPDAPLTPVLAREVAIREGYTAVLEGELNALGPATLLTAKLVSPKSGEVLATLEERARKPDQLLDAVDRLSGALRNRIGESLKVLRAEAPLEEVTTASLPALRLYSQASRAADAGERDEAIALLQRAVDLDPGFAMAWRGLGIELKNSGRDPARAEAALDAAYAHRQRLPERERGLTEGSYLSTSGDYAGAARTFARVLDAYPDEPLALNGQAHAESTLGNQEAALALYKRVAAQKPPSIVSFINVFAVARTLGRLDEAEAALEQAAAAFPRSPQVGTLRFALANARGRWDEAEAIMARLRREHPSAQAAYAFDGQDAAFRLARGDLPGAQAAIERQAARDVQEGLTGAALKRAANFAWAFGMTGERERGRAALAEALRRFPLEAMEPAERPYFELAETAAMLGDAAAARRYLQLGSADGRRDPFVLYDRPEATLGMIALAEGRPAEAVERLRTAGRVGQGAGAPVLYRLGLALEAAGRPEEARAVYRRRADSTAPGCVCEVGPALERLVVLHAAAGDRAGAADAARRLAELWTAPEARPRVLAAQALANTPVRTASAAAAPAS